MLITQFYIFQPTPALEEAMKRADEKFLAPVSVWSSNNHDRAGPENSQAEIEAAFWTVFLAKLIGMEPEPLMLTQLRATCLQLGFGGCWSVVCTTSGGPARELVEEAEEARLFLKENVPDVK